MQQVVLQSISKLARWREVPVAGDSSGSRATRSCSSPAMFLIEIRQQRHGRRFWQEDPPRPRLNVVSLATIDVWVLRSPDCRESLAASIALNSRLIVSRLSRAGGGKAHGWCVPDQHWASDVRPAAASGKAVPLRARLPRLAGVEQPLDRCDRPDPSSARWPRASAFCNGRLVRRQPATSVRTTAPVPAEFRCGPRPLAVA